MQGHLSGIEICELLSSARLMALTTVTTPGGTMNVAPAFAGSASVDHSPITISESNVGTFHGHASQ